MKNASSKITLLLLIAATMLLAGCATPTPLTRAVERGDIKEMERLIAAGADVNAKEGIDSWTPLHYAADAGNKEAAELLISKGADVDARGYGGLTPRLMVASGKSWSVDNLMIDRLAKEHETAKQAKIAAAIADKRAKIAAETDAEEAAYEAAFTEVTRNYRAATVKPALPEDARKFKVQAEFAVGKKEFEAAASRYKKALDLAPWWPEGRFNRALILGELSRYHDAIREMKRYLTLVPDAPNARTAQDKIYQWEGELK